MRARHAGRSRVTPAPAGTGFRRHSTATVHRRPGPGSVGKPMNRRFALIQALVSLIALGAVVWWAAKQKAPELPSGGGALAWLAAAVGLYALATPIRSQRWHWVLQGTGIETKRVGCYPLSAGGYKGHNLPPPRAGGALKGGLLSAP